MNKLSFAKYDRIEESIGKNPGAEKWIYKSALGRMEEKHEKKKYDNNVASSDTDCRPCGCSYLYSC